MNKVKSEVKEFYDNFKKVLFRPEMAILPGQLAYFFVLAIVPTIVVYCCFSNQIVDGLTTGAVKG